MIFLKYKTQYSRTIVLLNERKTLKETLFFKSDDCPAISRQEKYWLPKSTEWFPAKKDGILLPTRVALGLPPPPAESVRTDVRTLPSEPKFLASIGYGISLPTVLLFKDGGP